MPPWQQNRKSYIELIINILKSGKITKLTCLGAVLNHEEMTTLDQICSDQGKAKDTKISTKHFDHSFSNLFPDITFEVELIGDKGEI